VYVSFADLRAGEKPRLTLQGSAVLTPTGMCCLTHMLPGAAHAVSNLLSQSAFQVGAT